MGFIKTGANLGWRVYEGGVSISIRWSHLLSTAQDEDFSFIKFTHSIALTHSVPSYLPKGPDEPMRQYSGEVTAGRQGSSFHDKNPIQGECWTSALQRYILRKRKMMSWLCWWAPKNQLSIIILFCFSTIENSQKCIYAIKHCQMKRITWLLHSRCIGLVKMNTIESWHVSRIMGSMRRAAAGPGGSERKVSEHPLDRWTTCQWEKLAVQTCAGRILLSCYPAAEGSWNSPRRPCYCRCWMDGMCSMLKPAPWRQHSCKRIWT